MFVLKLVNVLFFDEVSNYLDGIVIEVLCDGLCGWEGVVIVIMYNFVFVVVFNFMIVVKVENGVFFV